MLKLFKNIKVIYFTIAPLLLLSGCAVGAATAAYSVKSQTADCLSSEGEERIIFKAKKEILSEIYAANPILAQHQVRMCPHPEN